MKQEILNRLTEVLQLTREYSDLIKLELKSDLNMEYVEVSFRDDSTKRKINVTCDSESAMIRDVIRLLPRR